MGTNPVGGFYMKFPIISILLLCSALLWAGPKGDVSSTGSGGNIDGTLTYLEGDVSVNGKEADLGMTVLSGSVLETGGNGYCEVEFLNGNIFRIEADSLLKMNLEPDHSSLELEKGSIGALFTKLDKLTGNLPFEVKTPSTTAGIRGTAFYIRIENPESTYFCVCNGSVYGESVDGEAGDLLQAGRHKAVRFIGNNGSYTMESAPLLYHDDDSMDELANKIGVNIPWGSY